MGLSTSKISSTSKHFVSLLELHNPKHSLYFSIGFDISFEIYKSVIHQVIIENNTTWKVSQIIEMINAIQIDFTSASRGGILTLYVVRKPSGQIHIRIVVCGYEKLNIIYDATMLTNGIPIIPNDEDRYEFKQLFNWLKPL